MGLPPLTESDRASIELLRRKGLSIRNLDPGTKASLRATMVSLHIERGVSLSDIALMVGNKTSGYTSYVCRELGVKARPFQEARLKGIREKRRKYERRPFDGTDEDKAYLQGIRRGDLSVSKPWGEVVRVSTSTTHPAMANLFQRLFGPHGHVYRYPRFKEDTNSYEWNLTVILGSSFEFLMKGDHEVWEWVSRREGTLLAYLAGLLDAEGSVGIHPSRKSTFLSVAYYNTSLDLLKFVYKSIGSLGYHPLKPYLDKKKGFRSPGFHIEMKKDYWRVLLAAYDEAQSFLKRLPLRHAEKVNKATLALGLPHRAAWKIVESDVIKLRAEVKKERD